MSEPLYRLYRLNFVDRRGLFEKPVKEDDQALEVLRESTNGRFDVVRTRTKHGYRWSLRNVTGDLLEEVARPYISGIFSLETLFRRGPIVRPEGVSFGTSEISPPTAVPVTFYVDLKRHIIAFEDVSAVLQQKTGWQKNFEEIVNSAAWSLGFTSRVELEPIAPHQAIEARLRSFDRITRIRLTLRIPNPDLSPTFARLFEELERGGVRELTEDMRSERGLSLEPDSLPKMAMDMALDGYRRGDIRIHGYRDGRAERFTVSDDVARIDLRETRAYAEGMKFATNKTGEKRLLRAIIERIDETLGRAERSNEHDVG